MLTPTVQNLFRQLVDPSATNKSKPQLLALYKTTVTLTLFDTIMGTDRHENDIRRKGRPAGRGKEGTNLRDASAVHNAEEEKEVRNRYLDDDGTPADDAKLRHPNRNPIKGTEE